MFMNDPTTLEKADVVVISNCDLEANVIIIDPHSEPIPGK